METFTPKFRRDGNQKIHSIYYGVANGHQVAKVVMAPSWDHSRMDRTITREQGLPRGASGEAAVIILGGMETTLDEMEYILEARKEKKFVPKRGPGEIAQMCKLVAEKRNDQILAQRIQFRKNPSERLPKRPTLRLHLPVGVRYMATTEPGLRVLATV